MHVSDLCSINKMRSRTPDRQSSVCVMYIHVHEIDSNLFESYLGGN